MVCSQPFIESVLTFLPGIPYVQRKLGYSGSAKWKTFWNYIEKTWLGTYPPSTWNVNSLVHLQNRTSNPLERYNRELNELFKPSYPPNLLVFISTLRTHIHVKYSVFRRVRSEGEAPPSHRQELPQIMADPPYVAFREEEKKQELISKENGTVIRVGSIVTMDFETKTNVLKPFKGVVNAVNGTSLDISWEAKYGYKAERTPKMDASQVKLWSPPIKKKNKK